MKLFVLLSRFPYPLEKGDKVRAFHQIKLLSKNYDIVLCAFHEGPFDPEQLDMLKPYCKAIKIIHLNRKIVFLNLLRTLFLKIPFQVGYFYSSSAHQKIRQMISQHKPDAVYCQLIRMAEYVRKDDTKIKVLDYMDAFSKGVERRIAHLPFFLKPFFKIELKRLIRYEAAVMKDFSSLTVISEQDKKFIGNLNNNSIHVVPNGVDTTYFRSAEMTKKYELLFTGNMSYPPNVECAILIAQQIIPLIKKEFPTVKLLIAGANPSSKVKNLASENVTVKGWEEDIRPSYDESRIFLAPLFLGSGMQNKILEAMSMNLACLTTDLVNNAIHANPETEIVLANSPEAFAAKVIELLRNPDKLKAISVAGNAFVKRNYSWDSAVKKLAVNIC